MVFIYEIYFIIISIDTKKRVIFQNISLLIGVDVLGADLIGVLEKSTINDDLCKCLISNRFFVSTIKSVWVGFVSNRVDDMKAHFNLFSARIDSNLLNDDNFRDSLYL